ncbi:MAG: tetratricopeptide repeat protein [Saprospiraceae bacterium]|nr:tetratricopeptide repeat protein [Saprospiraceae bacterium]
MSKKNKNTQASAKSAVSKSSENHPVGVAAPSVVSERLMLAGCLLLTFLVFANTFNAGFVNWDDHGYLWLNPMVQPLGSMDLGQIFTGHTHGNYSPLVVLTYCFEHTFDTVVKPGQMSVENFQPFLYHFNNVLLHVGTTALAFFFFRALGVRGWGLALGTALFGIHPMRVESVAWVTERKDVLYGLFYIAALLAYWKYLAEQKSKYYVFALVLGLLSLFSKIQAVSLPLSMLALDWLAGRDLKNMKVWLEKVPFFALSLVFGLVGIHFLGEAEGFKDAGYSVVERFFFATTSLWNYLYKTLVPLGLSAYYPYPKSGAMPALYYASPLALAAIGWWVWGSLKHGKTVAFGFVFFLVNIVFVLQFKGAGKAFMADRFTYIPYLGLFFILAKTYSDIDSGKIKTGLKNTLPYLAAGFLALCAVLTVMQNNTWKSSISLWENVTAKHPKDALSWSNLGLAYDDLEAYEKSVKAYEQAIKVDPLYFDANFNLAVAFNKLKRFDEAAQMFGRCMELKPDFTDSWYARGQVYLLQSEFSKAIVDLEKFAQMQSKEPVDKIQSSIGMAYAGAGQHERAIAAFDRAIQAKADPEHHFRKGNALAAMGNMQAAIASYDNALRIAPDYSDAVNNKGNAYASMGKFSEALLYFDEAIKMNPGAANFKFNRGMARRSAGDPAGACADWQQAAAGGYTQAQSLIQQFCK